MARTNVDRRLREALNEIAAEELQVDWARVKAQPAPAAQSWVTGGSTSIRAHFQPMRVAGAAAREMLIAAAAHKLFLERNDAKPFDAKSTDAHKAATDAAARDGVTLTVLKIDPTTNTVHVTVVKQAKSIVIKHIRPLRHLDEITVSESAAPK